MRYVKHPKKIFWDSFSFSGTCSLVPIEDTTHSGKCIGVIEKDITYMKSTFPESEGDFQETQVIYVRLA